MQGIGVRLEFADGSTLVIVPTADELEDPQEGETAGVLADWELATPRGRLQVGPGQIWKWAAAPAAQAT